MYVEFTHAANGVKHLKGIEVIKIQVANVIYTIRQFENYIEVTKVDNEDPTNKPLVVVPVHGQKVKIV